MQCIKFKNTVEPPSKGHFGTNHSVHCREAVLFSEVLLQWEYLLLGQYEVSFMKSCPFLGGSFIGGSTVMVVKVRSCVMDPLVKTLFRH